MAKKTGIFSNRPVRSALRVLSAGMLCTVLLVPQLTYAEEEEKTVTAAVDDTGVTFSTNYPGVTVKPGNTANFDLYITNTGEKEANVSLTADNLPDGWEGRFKGKSNQISMVHISALQTKDDSPSLSYSLTVPEDAAEDTYTVTLNISGADIDEDLDLTIKVDYDEIVFGAGAFTTDYAEQEGTAGTKFRYSTSLTNNSAQDQTYSFAAEGTPEGWNVSFTPSDAGAATSSAPVAAGGTSKITVAVTPAQNVMAGEYPLTLTATSADETLELPVTVRITGSYSLRATTPSGNLSTKAYAGETKDETVTLVNDGNIDLNNIALSAQASTDWEVTFDKDVIDFIPAGESVDVTAHITPSKDAILGDYVTIVTAKNDVVSSECDFRVSVQNHTSWGIVAVGIIAVLIVVLILIIRKFGRR